MARIIPSTRATTFVLRAIAALATLATSLALSAVAVGDPLPGLGGAGLRGVGNVGDKPALIGQPPADQPPANQSPRHIQNLRAIANMDHAEPGASFLIGIVFDVSDELHINSHEPLDQGLIATTVTINKSAIQSSASNDKQESGVHEQVPGVHIGAPIFPAGQMHEFFGQKLSVYRGRVLIAIPVRLDSAVVAQGLRFSGTLTYQACDDKSGVCYRPETVPWSIDVPIAEPGQSTTPIHRDEFAEIETQIQKHGVDGAETKSSITSSTHTTTGFTLDSPIRPTTQQESHSFGVWLVLALLAGIILNVTPCVLPVISIKVLSFVQQANSSPARVFKLGLAFSLGMLIVFNALAVMATSLGLVWGQHFQSPTFTIVMASIVFAFGLSLFGIFTLSVPRTVGDLAGKADGDGYGGSVAKGMLATVMGTPCLGPFLGPVLVWASSQPAAIVFMTFNTIGVGMALPYILLTANPRWLRFVPKPGPWLTTFKQAMAFLLMGTVVYLLYILEGQRGGSAVVRTLVLLTAVALAGWMVGQFVTFNSPASTRWTWRLIALAIVAATAYITFGQQPMQAVSTNATSAFHAEGAKGANASAMPWVPFSMEKLTELTQQGKPVLLDITARWCPNCQYNSAFVFDSPAVVAAVQKRGVVPMLADWTAGDRVIGELIEKLAPGASIPLAAIFPPSRANEPIVMLGILTQQQVVDHLTQVAAAPSQ